MSHLSQEGDGLAREFPRALGSLADFRYPTSHHEARQTLEDFLVHRFSQFGAYEDAIDGRLPICFIPCLPPLNIGLISPRRSQAACSTPTGCLNSLEGFLRQ